MSIHRSRLKNRIFGALTRLKSRLFTFFAGISGECVHAFTIFLLVNGDFAAINSQKIIKSLNASLRAARSKNVQSRDDINYIDYSICYDVL